MSTAMPTEPRNELLPSAAPHRATLLVVDDHPTNLKLLYQAFSADYQVLMATSGAQALAMCRDKQPDLVLLDVAMPQMDGYTVCRELKNDPYTCHIPIIFVTSHSDPEEETHGLELGAVDFIAKPINPAVVRSRVKTHIALMQSSALILSALKEKETLLKEVYHRVKNNLQVISSLFNLQLRSLTDEQARTALNESIERVSAMALVHEKLYQSSTLSSISLADYVNDLCRHLRESSGTEARGIELSAHVTAVTVNMETAVPLGLLINELIANSLKHGFPDGRRGRIRVNIEQHANGLCMLEVADDGVGNAEPPGMPPRPKSLGLKLITALAAQIDGTVHTRTSEDVSLSGTTTRVSFTHGSSKPHH
jgi:two-component sensor histidine kinase